MHLRRYKSLFEKQKTKFIGQLVNFQLLDPNPDPSPQYGSGSRTAKMNAQLRIHADPDPQPWYNANLYPVRIQGFDNGKI
jgi:hypothetical protein